MRENKYYVWFFLEPNESGLTHVLHDKVRETWYLVHASGYRFPLERKGRNELVGRVKFCV